MKYRPTLLRALLRALLGLGLTLSAAQVQAELVIVTSAASSVSELDVRQLRNLYKGRLSRLADRPIKPLDAKIGSADREAFLEQILGQNEYDYSGYWHVRRYTGQGTPPVQTESRDDLFNRLRSQPNSIGYVWIKSGEELPAGLKALQIKAD